MENKWTPGPWHVEKFDKLTIFAEDEGDHGRAIATCASRPISGYKLGELEANAQIIAQAPAMAAALLCVVNAQRDLPLEIDEEIFRILREAGALEGNQ